MENEVNFLRKFIVILALLGYISCAISLYVINFEILDPNCDLPPDYEKSISSVLLFLTSSLNGLVGGIVAGTFGVPIIVKTSEPGNGKLSMLGALFSNTNKHIYGLLYAISYIVIGVSGIVIWVVLDENTISVISEMSKIFIGMLIAIVITFFSPQKLFYPTK